MAPSRAPMTFSSANRAGVRPMEASTSAGRVCIARQSRKKSCPANSVTGGSAEAWVAISCNCCTVCSVVLIICRTNYQLTDTPHNLRRDDDGEEHHHERRGRQEIHGRGTSRDERARPGAEGRSAQGGRGKRP